MIELKFCTIYSISTSEQPPRRHKSLHAEKRSLNMNGYSRAKSCMGESYGFVNSDRESYLAFVAGLEFLSGVDSPNIFRNSSIVGSVKTSFFFLVGCGFVGGTVSFWF